MWEHQLTEKELELVEILKTKELTKNEAFVMGYDISRVFLFKCHFHNVLIYESDETDKTKKYGVLV